MSMRPLSIIFLLLLGACATEEQRADDTANYIKQNYSLVCEKLGYTPGSEKHSDCMVSMFNTDQIRSGGAAGGALRRRW
jgi:hypothetical protein